MKGTFFTIVIQIAILGVILCGCKGPQPEADKLLSQAEIFMEDHPDSAMLLIDSIFYPEKSFNKENLMRYQVLKVQAKNKVYRPIDEDTLIFQARDYFSERDKDDRMAAKAWYYSGWVYREQKEYEKAVQHYKTAGDYAAKVGDTDLQGLLQYNIGDLFYEQGLYKEALKYYMGAVPFFENKPEKQPQCFSAIGRMYMVLQQPDSAFLYFHKGLEIAETRGDKNYQSLLTQNLSVAYRNTGQFDEAETYLRQSYLLNSDSVKIPRYYLNLAKLYSGVGREDSAALYTERLKLCLDASEDDHFKLSAYSFLAGWEKERGNYDEAFGYQEAQMGILRHIMEQRNSRSVYEAHLKYDNELLQKQYYKDLSVRQFWIIVLLAMVLLGGTLSTWYWFRQRKRRNEAQQNIDTLEGMNLELKNEMYQRQADLRRVLLWRFDVTRGVIDLNKEINKPGSARFDKSHWMKRFNKIVYGKEDVEEVWDTLFATFNESRPGLAQKIKEKYPDLTEVEFRVCILVYSGFNINETALILDLKPNTIQSRRSSARHKMGLDTRGDIAAHIDLL